MPSRAASWPNFFCRPSTRIAASLNLGDLRERSLVFGLP
jgi:hypothetical protein